MALRTALLVIDMQVFFQSMTTSSLPNVKRLISHFQANSLPIIFTQHGHSKEELNQDPSPNQLVRKWGPSGSIAHDSSAWQFQDELTQYLDKSDANGWPKVVSKNTYDAFINTNLSDVLQEAKIERVVVCGVMTDCCCDTTARGAFNRGLETWLISDACGSANKAQHQAGLKGFEFAFGDVMKTKEAISLLGDDQQHEAGNCGR